jgi:hypothetical protein
MGSQQLNNYVCLISNLFLLRYLPSILQVVRANFLLAGCSNLAIRWEKARSHRYSVRHGLLQSIAVRGSD